MRPREKKPNLIDRSVKVLIRRAPPVFLRLARVDLQGARIRATNVTINLPEFAADDVFLVESATGKTQGAFHLEYQLQPDARELRGWFLKNAALTRQLKVPVALIVLYLQRRQRATFPDCYRAVVAGVTTEFRFQAIRLWEHADRIRTGELRELAPLLVLCEDKPAEETLNQERELILGLDAPQEVRSDLLGLALTVAGRYFARDLLLAVFREEITMARSGGLVEEWIAEGEARGKAQEAQDFLLRLLRRKFGEPPASLVERIRTADAARCEELGERLMDAGSLEDLN